MSSITTINSGDLISTSRTDINTNFSNLNTDKIETSYLDTDTTLAANSDSKIATQKAVKAYVDTQGGANASTTVRGVVELATAAEINAGTATGATGAALVVTPDQLKLATSPVINVYGAASLGDSTTQFDITNPAGTTFRYTWDSTGTDPGISTTTVPTGATVIFFSTAANIANCNKFTVTGSGTNYFEVTNASGVAQNNVTLASDGILQVTYASTWTKPSGLKYVEVEVCGGGGGGGGSNDAQDVGGGGGGGGYSKKIITAASLGSTETATPGAGGTMGLSTGTSGGDGGTTTFGSHIQATGGSGGVAGNNLAAGGDGGVGSLGTLNIRGGFGGGGLSHATGGGFGGHGGNSFFGGAGGVTTTTSGSLGRRATAWGGGGGGSANDDASGSDNFGGVGFGGVVIVTEYYN